ncbi:RidA family protein [Aeromicrobium sp. YIM 150415]|uniref:RidA family protein n=1 Tax=Aeromicrobium sp. YIM 150415 TaxID=2803912 RepID=UPI0019624EFD|nr:RidA family protein [Aeromicrobium sp. YIM 150415]MBM9463593.1 RidA family protein [Aeromicrobium sp. YIM 150415]
MATQARRASIDVDGLAHGDLPLPAGSRVGPFIATGGVRGVDRATGTLSADIRDQIHSMFDNLISIVDAGGGSVDSILKVTIWARDRSIRPALDEVWIRHFPDPSSRPARHLQVTSLPGEQLVQCEALAVAHDHPQGEPA